MTHDTSDQPTAALAPKNTRTRAELLQEISTLKGVVERRIRIINDLENQLRQMEMTTVPKRDLYRKMNQWAKALGAEFPIHDGLPLKDAYAIVSNAIWENMKEQAVDELAE